MRDLDADNRLEVVFLMSSRILANLRIKKKCIERAIRALEELEKLEQDVGSGSEPGRSGDGKVIEIPRRQLRA